MSDDEPKFIVQCLVQGEWLTDPDSAMQVIVADFVREHFTKIYAAREQAIEAAVQTGECGVFETIDHTTNPPTHTFEVTRDVPYGCLYEMEINCYDR